MFKRLFTLLLIGFLYSAPSTAADEVDNGIQVVGASGPDPESTHYAGLNQRIRLTVDNLAQLKAEAEAQGKAIIPYVDGLPLAGVKTDLAGSKEVLFDLRKTPESKATWSTLVKQRSGFLYSDVTLSVGLEDAAPVPTQVRGFQIGIAKKNLFVICLIAVLGLLGLFLWLAERSNIIRDAGPEPPDGSRRPYSIGHAQMAFWFFLIIICYPFIWLVTGELGSITGSVLGLMGISAGTALGASVIDSSKRNAAVADRSRLSAERDALGGRLREIAANLGKTPAGEERAALQAEMELKKARYKEIDDQIKRIPPQEGIRSSKGFVVDLVSDRNGVSFHRFQILAWTLVLGIIFVAEVFTNLRMPEFSDTLLGLMGVSSGTYIGFKFPEQREA